MAARISISPSPETQRQVHEQAAALGFPPGASLSSIYTMLAEEGLRARLQRVADAELLRAYDAWAQDAERLAANQEATEMAFEDGLV